MKFSILNIIGAAMSLLIGEIIYLNRWPEKKSPGKFDILG